MNKKDTDIAIKVTNVSKRFKYNNSDRSLKSKLINKSFLRRNEPFHNILKDIDLSVEKGDFFAIVGRNGSGKSTLLKIIAGVYSHDAGSVSINGKLVPFIELGVGFNPELTGRDNVYLNAALLGFSRKQTADMYDSIVKFAELDEYMDEKLKNYSSGMQVRLAFSIAIRANSDILLIDEVLAVGDLAFQKKCFDYFTKLKKTHKTMVLVSHDAEVIRRYCDKAAYIKDGKIVESGAVQKVISKYETDIADRVFSASSEKSTKQTDSSKLAEERPTSQVRIVKSKLLNKQSIGPNELVKIEMICKATENIEAPIFGITIRKRGSPEPVYASNTYLEDMKTKDMKIGDTARVVFEFTNYLGNGNYVADLAVAESSGTIFYDKKSNTCAFNVNGWRNPWVNVHIPGKIELSNE